MTNESEIEGLLDANAVVQFLSNLLNLGNENIAALNAGTFQVQVTKKVRGKVISSIVTIRTKTGWTTTLAISNGSVGLVTMKRTGPQLKE
jgi:hypothetical protein